MSKTKLSKSHDANSRLAEQLTRVVLDDTDFGRRDFPFHDRKRAAVLALFRGDDFLNSEILLILRSQHVTLNPGQVALPGGSAEDIDGASPIQTALRETFEEVGISPQSVHALGVLPPLPTVSGKLSVDCVVGTWMGADEAVLALQATEVDHAEWMPVSKLISSRSTETRMVHGVEMELPVFLWGEHRMWGLTAMIFDLIRKRYDKLFG